MKLVVCDLEMNQPSGRIIQIGAVQLDCRTGKISDPFDRIVHPKFWGDGEKLLSPEIVELTGITQERLDAEGLPLAHVLHEFWAYVGSKPMAAWGRDVWLLIEASRTLGVAHKIPRALDVKSLGEILRCIYPGKTKGGLKSTMEAFGMQFQGRQHDAVRDARNTARLIQRWLAPLRAAERLFEAVQEARS